MTDDDQFECEVAGCAPDALGRHDSMCPRAIRLGLPRLAEGEEPIPHDAEADMAEAQAEGNGHEPRGPWMEAEDTEGEAAQDQYDATNDLTQCVACLQFHISPATRGECIKVGKSLVHPDCQWRVHYDDRDPGKIIEVLEEMAVKVEDESTTPEDVRRQVLDVLDG